jgi:diguanylate cyclase (GGDEF)-like protein/PAS domain S-box-containing protein
VEDGGDGDAVRGRSDDHLGSVVTRLPVPMGIHASGRIVLVNPALATLLGAASPADLEGCPVAQVVHPDDLATISEQITRSYGGVASESAEVRVLRADGSALPVEVSSLPITFDGAPAALVDFRDISAQLEAQEALRVSEARWRALVQHGNDLIAVLDADARFTYVSPSTRTILDRDPEDLLGTDALALLHPDDVDAASAAFSERLVDGGRRHEGMRVRVRALDGSWRWLETFAANMLDDADVAGVIINAWDVTHTVLAEGLLRYAAQHDALTGLPNRVLLAERLETALSDGRRFGTVTGLLMLDLDRFKDVNDTLGHESGDRVLAELAGRLEEAVRIDDVVGRIGGDEFAVVLPDAGDHATVEAVARRILDACAEPVEDEGMLLRVGASIGMVLAPEHGDESSLLLRRVDAAMYRAKEARVGVVAASEGDLDEGRRRLAVAAELRDALDADQLFCEYQPKVSLATGRVVGVEALVRWRHPERGWVEPDAFLADAEHLGLMAPFTRFVLGDALRRVVAWTAEGLDLTVAVNVSATMLHDPGFVAMVDDALAQSGADPGRVLLEVTEQAAMVHPEVSLATMAELVDRGVRFSIDDFGTGQSSLTYLRRLPVVEVKIDRSFVVGVQAGTPDGAIARSVVDLAHNLGLLAVAEGIESEESLAVVRSYACDLGQGWHLGRPMAPEDVPAWCRRRFSP